TRGGPARPGRRGVGLLPPPPAPGSGARLRRTQRRGSRRDDDALLRFGGRRPRPGPLRRALDHPAALGPDHPGGDRVLLRRAGTRSAGRAAPRAGLGRPCPVGTHRGRDARRRPPDGAPPGPPPDADHGPRRAGRVRAAGTDRGAPRGRRQAPHRPRDRLRPGHDGRRRPLPYPPGAAGRDGAGAGGTLRAGRGRTGGAAMNPLTARQAVDRAVDVMPPLGLDEVQAAADLQTRTDRKYLVPAADFLAMTRELDGALAVLEIDGLRRFDYESVYFDTPELEAHHAHAHDRRRR